MRLQLANPTPTLLLVVAEDFSLVNVEVVAVAEVVPHPFPTTDNRPLCQVCQKPSHTALVCYHHFNQAYQAPPPSSLAANFTALPSSAPQSNVWFQDTATKNYFTSDFSNLNLDSTTYQGSDQVSIGDGSTLPIQHIGTAHLNSSSGKFLISQLLHVPSITRNLLSVRSFCLDNSVFFEFHSIFFFVNDLHTRAALLQGHVKDGLYELPTTVSATSFPRGFTSSLCR